MKDLVEWKQSPRRKPLILQGARQVGKTWLLREFGRQHYDTVAYVNFEETPTVNALFEGDFDLDNVLAGLRIAAGSSIEPGATLVILDEIQECPRALTALKYFAENRPDYHIACAGSLLGVALHEHSSFPVGKVNFIDMYPLTFSEFAEAMGEQALLAPLIERDWPLVTVFHERYVALLRNYLYVGGMPEPVSVFASERDYGHVRSAQLDILMAYDRDFSKHAPTDQVPRIRAVWESIPNQLAKDNSRFVYGAIESGARGRQYEIAIQWLKQTGLVHQVNRVSAPRLPLGGYEQTAIFKLYALDVGLLGALSHLDAAVILEKNRLFTEFKGSLTENYAAQQLVATPGMAPSYWANSSGTAEVDFVAACAGEVIPIEVKAERNLKAKSLKVYRSQYQPAVSIRTSLTPYNVDDGLIDLPLYAIEQLRDVIRDVTT